MTKRPRQASLRAVSRLLHHFVSAWPHWSEGRIRRTVCVMPEPDEEPRPGPEGAFVSNWTTYDAPFVAKLRMAASNTFIKLRKRQACCGNHGQPGC